MKLFTTISVLLLLLCTAVPAMAQTEVLESAQSAKPAPTEPPKQATPEKSRKEKVHQLSPKRRHALMIFVTKHHPELATMLRQLEKEQASSFQKAILGINRSVSKVELVKRRNPKRHLEVLRQWKIDSRIKVAAAQMKLKDSQENREKLEGLITELIDFNIERLKQERQQTIERLVQLDERIAESESGRDEAITERFQIIVAKQQESAETE